MWQHAIAAYLQMFLPSGKNPTGYKFMNNCAWLMSQDGKTPSGALRKILKVKRGGPAGEAPPAFSPLPQYSSSPAYDQTGSNTLRQMLNIGRTAPEAGSSGGGDGAYSGIDRGNGGIGSHRSAYSGTGLSGAYSGNGIGGASSGTGKSRAARSGGVGGNAAAGGSGGGSFGLPDSLDLAMGSLDIGSHASPAPAPAPAPAFSNVSTGSVAYCRVAEGGRHVYLQETGEKLNALSMVLLSGPEPCSIET